MPFESEQQRKAMYAAAAGHSNIGIPQSVGEKFVRHGSDSDIPEEATVLSTPDEDPCWEGYQQVGMKEKGGKEVPNCVPDAVVPRLGEEPHATVPVDKDAGAAGRASGIMFLTDTGEALMIRRGNGGDYPGTWAVPGGHQNSGETLEECARRECFEETGIKYEGALEVLYDDGQFCTYIARHAEKVPVKLNDESTGYDWCSIDTPPQPLHPGQAICMRIASANTEYQVAELIRDGLLPSPQMYANVMLLAIRITGTGLAYRSSIGEHVWRDPSLYLNQDFLNRCNGLIVLMDHPDTSVLTSKEFNDRAVGSVILPYIKGDEVWGIAKIYDQPSINEILEGDISTSPAVVFDNTAGNTTLTTENGEPLLIEGVPFLLDHIAIVTKARGSKGVWDKGGEPAGVLLTNPEVSDMTEKVNEPKADAQGDKLDAILNAVGALAARVDSMEKNLPAPPLVTAADKKAKKDEEVQMDDDDSKKDDDSKAKKHRKDAKGSDEGKEEAPAGEMKPDDDCRMDDDDEEEMAKKADEEAAKYADAQAKADSVLAGFGKSASRPLQGESVTSYRKRLLRGMQAYSDSFKGIDLNSIRDAKLLDLAEKQIFADAAMASRNSAGVPAGQLVEIHERDRAGRIITKFKGSMSAWLDDFKLPAHRVTSFHTANNAR